MKTTIYVALLRGINVSGKNLIPMAALSACFQQHGFDGVKTYIQSGNVIFQYPASDTVALSERIADMLKNCFGTEIPVIVKAHEELTDIISGNPFIGQGASTDKLHVTLISGRPAQSLKATNLALKNANDEAIISGNIIYLYCPDGYGKTKFSNSYFEKELKVQATTRNWKTLLHLVDLSGSS